MSTYACRKSSSAAGAAAEAAATHRELSIALDVLLVHALVLFCATLACQLRKEYAQINDAHIKPK